MALTEWIVYIIETKSNKFYTGITTDLDRRFNEHVQGRIGARYFHLSAPDRVIFRESHPNGSLASKRERAIKKLTHQEKLTLINNE